MSELLPKSGFVRLPTILKLLSISKSTWWNGIKSGKFPKSVKLGNRITVWHVENIKELIKGLPSGR